MDETLYSRRMVEGEALLLSRQQTTDSKSADSINNLIILVISLNHSTQMPQGYLQ